MNARANHEGTGSGSSASESRSVRPIELEMQKYLKRFAIANEKQKHTPGDESEKQICLTSRSAFGAIYNWAVLHDELDEKVNLQLREQFQIALSVMSDSEYRHSVEGRFADFESLCRRIAGGLEAASLSATSL